MAKLEDLIKQIPDAKLRAEIAREAAALKATKKFGLVFEEHIPEQVQLPNLPVRTGSRVVKRGNGKQVFQVIDIKGKTAQLMPEPEGQEETAKLDELVVVKRFGEPIYPTLTPRERIERAPDKPWHTIINADNFHALQLLLYCYEGMVDVIYIDPPYNTGARDWKYNNDYVDRNDQYRHSKWLAMIKRRVILASKLLKSNGILIVTIDDNELFHLGTLLEEQFPAHDLFTITIEHNKRGRRGKNFAKSNEWAIFLVPKGKDVIREESMGQTIGGETRNLRRTGSGSKRTERWRKFYPIWVNEETLEIVEAGDPVQIDASWEVTRKNGLISVWPIDEDGKEKNWHYGIVRTRQAIEDGKLEARPQSYGIQIYYTLREKDSKKYKTVWSKPALDASTYGSELLDEILGDEAEFEYPKSLYAVLDCLKASCGHLKDALILDFFAGSGTTLHASALLNSEDGGSRRCILVTNNEVNEKLATGLNERGVYTGQAEFEQYGICESVTWPRSKFVLNGKRDDGTELSGIYLSELETKGVDKIKKAKGPQVKGRKMKEGFEENIEYFRLDFLDPHEVAVGEKFEAIAPILWLMAGAQGKRENDKGEKGWFIPKGSPFAVLIDEHAFNQFKKAIAKRTDLTHIFLVTDSIEGYRSMIAQLPEGVKTKMLYKSYLDNFKINIEGSL
ncbi:MAG TPA: site-specific DNA-methyltransferase [Anaerolineales bacterium]|mgnify:CR=1 FL=1|nr:site-specific DNA-methyltransferase [Anaerolineales bacterium]